MEQEKLTPPDIKMATGVGQPPEPLLIEPMPIAPALPPAGGTAPDFFAPETFGPSPIPEGVTSMKSRALKTIFIVLGAIVFIGGLGALSYFVIFPLLFPTEAPQQVQRPPVVTKPVATHESFLANPPAAEAEIKLADNNYLTIATALQNESFNQLADGQFKEIEISDNNGQVTFPNYLGAIAPATSALGSTDWFQNDFTALLYYDPSGIWPIYVAKFKTGVDPEAVKSAFKTLENIIELANFYLAPPGTFGVFKDGKAGSYQTRYAVGTQAGAAFNYGIFGNYLIFSTNYNGLKSALPLLGL